MKKARRFLARTRGSKKGFSLVEVIVASGLAVIIATAMLPLFTQGAYYLGQARKLRAQAAEANESIKLGSAVSSATNNITYGEAEKYKIKTSITLPKFDPGDKDRVMTGGAAHTYVFVRAGSSNNDTNTVVYYSDYYDYNSAEE